MLVSDAHHPDALFIPLRYRIKLSCLSRANLVACCVRILILVIEQYYIWCAILLLLRTVADCRFYLHHFPVCTFCSRSLIHSLMAPMSVKRRLAIRKLKFCDVRSR